jgi:hypothetical protein
MPAVPKGLLTTAERSATWSIFSLFSYMPVLTTRKINTDCTLIDYVDFEEPPEIEINELY